MTADLRPIYYHEARARLVGNRLAVYMALTEAGPSTPKELAARMGWDVTSVRPRITEMRQIHAVIETGIRRNSEHEFRALTEGQMRTEIDIRRVVAQAAKDGEHLAGTFRELKQMEIFA